MKATMSIVSAGLRNIRPYGDINQGDVGHNFEFLARLKVQPRTLGIFSGESINYPQLEWLETIEWFEFNSVSNLWIYRGRIEKNMYRENPHSHTFKKWNDYHYTFSKEEINCPPAGLMNSISEKDIKHWIAHHGFEWDLPISDKPRMRLQGGTGGGGAPSLVTGNSRRRVIYFDLGFSGGGPRVKCTQILETLNGNITIHKFIDRQMNSNQVNDPNNLARWLIQLHSPQNWAI